MASANRLHMNTNSWSWEVWLLMCYARRVMMSKKIHLIRRWRRLIYLFSLPLSMWTVCPKRINTRMMLTTHWYTWTFGWCISGRCWSVSGGGSAGQEYGSLMPPIFSPSSRSAQIYLILWSFALLPSNKLYLLDTILSLRYNSKRQFFYPFLLL